MPKNTQIFLVVSFDCFFWLLRYESLNIIPESIKDQIDRDYFLNKFYF